MLYFCNIFIRKRIIMLKVSIIIPIYKVEKYIERCLLSIMSQTKAASHFSLECILVDDCSPDHSMDIVKHIINQHRNTKSILEFKFLRHNVNRGVSAARNTGLDHATGEYILFVDSDDYLLPNSLSTFIEAAYSHPEIDMIICNAKEVRSNKLTHRFSEPTLMDDEGTIIYNILDRSFMTFAWNRLIKRELLVENNIRFLEGILFEDQPWNYTLSFHLRSILLMPDVTYIYEDNPKGITALSSSTVFSKKTIQSYRTIADYYLGHRPNSQRYRRNLEALYLINIHDTILMDCIYSCIPRTFSRTKTSYPQ